MFQYEKLPCIAQQYRYDAGIMATPPRKSPTALLRLKKLEVENYKRLDSLTLYFPGPQLDGDPDILVLGSENGGGKTSVIECIGLLFLCILAPRTERLFGESGWLTDLADLFIKSGCESCTIKGEFEIGTGSKEVNLKISRQAEIKISGDKDEIVKHWKRQQRWEDLTYPDEALTKLLGITGEPLIIPPLIHFNSSRKVQEGSIDLGALAERSDPRARMAMSRNRLGGRPISTISAFKTEMLASLLGQASLFEGMSASQSKATAEKLNELLLRYAGGKIDQLRNLKGGSIDFRVRREGSEDSFTFDALSSGQKEIVSTLFLIWRHSEENPAIVLIDEPELHLNAEWHADFVRQLTQLAPRNQYILATHSEHIFGSVDNEHRALLIPNKI